MRSKAKRRHTVKSIVVLATALLVAAFLLYLLYPYFVEAYEDVSYAIDPSPALAFKYGEDHFSNAKSAREYDLGRAKYFLKLAAAGDPMVPYVYHELARIEFLKGNYNVAMSYIDTQIKNQGDKTPNSYYVRGLIEGFDGEYGDSVQDYAHYLQFDPGNWAATNDYAWVLLKADMPQTAAAVTGKMLAADPANPWLLNSNAIALYEIGDQKDAASVEARAMQAVANLTDAEWLVAYPGNDPRSAADGVASFKSAVEDNMHMIIAGAATSTIQ